MASFTPSITKRQRKRRLLSGAIVMHTRFVVSFREPRSGRRKQLFFERHKDAVAKRNELLTSVLSGAYTQVNTDLTVTYAMGYWLANRRDEVKKGTWQDYRQVTRYIVGPLLVGTKQERKFYTQSGKKPATAKLVEMLGPVQLGKLSTADIRNWHKNLTILVSGHSADLAKKLLRAALALVAEDFELRVPPMPSRRGRSRIKPVKAILSPEQIGCLLRAAAGDENNGLYYAFPFLTGVRPSEQLALHWEDIDLAAGIIRIRRMQERDGSITELTKTAAGMREIPISPILQRCC